MKVTERSFVLAATGLIALAALGVAAWRNTWVGFYFPMSEGVLAIPTVIAGSIITKYMPKHAVGRILLWAGLVLALAQVVAAFSVDAVSDPAQASGVAGALVSILQFTSLTMLTVLIARFPDGSWTTETSRWLAFAFVGVVGIHVVLLVGGALGIVGPSQVAETIGMVAFRAIPLFGLVITLHVVVHLLRSDPMRRRQMAVVLFAMVLALVPEAIVEGFDVEVGLVGGVLRGLLVLFIPASIVVAVLRYRLYEIDRIISRTVTYGLVVAAMAGVYLTVLLGLGSLLDLGGDTEVALATLAAVAVSVPLLNRVRRWVDRRFFRSRYDSALVVARVADDLRTTVDLDEVERRTEAVIGEVFSPEDVTVWLADRTAS